MIVGLGACSLGKEDIIEEQGNEGRKERREEKWKDGRRKMVGWKKKDGRMEDERKKKR